MSRATSESLLHALDHAYDRTSWHGPNLRSAIRGLKLERAARRPAPGRHNIWELVVHCAYWKYAVLRTLEGGKRGAFPLRGSNWFRREARDGAARWKADLALLDEMHARLREAVMKLPPKRWSEKTKTGRWTLRDVVAGAAAHDLYHAGQIRLIKVLGR